MSLDETRVLNEPLMEVKEVLNEAKELLTRGGHSRTSSDENILEETTTIKLVQPSPKHASQPLEVIVRHSQIVSESNSEDEKGDDDGFCEALEAQENSELRNIGHRRSSRRWSESMNGEHMSLSMSAVEGMMDDGFNHHHRRVRYRLQRHNLNGDILNRSDENLHEEDDELEVEMDEDEIMCFPGLETAKKGTRTIMKRFWEARWKVQHFDFLPDWLQDNEYLRTGHRPPLPSFGACFKSIFALHTETGNIWTHMFGCVLFIGIAGWFLTRPIYQVQLQEKLVFSFFFVGAIACLGMSFAFHTVSCHSANVVKLFSKLDYLGISLLIIGSFIPWIFYGFYCRREPQITYIAMVMVLGVAAVIVSLWDKFSESRYRPLRAGVFVAMGLSGVIPAVHFMITDGLKTLFEENAFHWLLLMAFLYLTGAGLYATRTPERFFPGKCDLWFQSHQLFHLCVVVAAFVHYHGISEMAVNRLQGGSCPEQRSADYLV